MSKDEIKKLFGHAVAFQGDGSYEQAKHLYLDIIQIIDSLSDSDRDIETIYFLGHVYMNLALILNEIGEMVQARTHSQHAIGIFEFIRNQYSDANAPCPPFMQNSLASAYMNLANLLQNTGETAQAKVHYQQAIDIGEGIRMQCAERSEPWPPMMQNSLASAYVNLANLLQNTGETAQAKVHYQQAIDIGEGIHTQCAKSGEPWPPSMQNDLAGAYMNLANLLKNAGETAQAKTHYQQAIDIGEGIRTQCAEHGEPWPPSMQNDLAGAYMNLAVLLQNAGETAQAKIHYQQAIDIGEAIRTQCAERGEPWPPSMQNDLAMVYMNLANLLQNAGETAQAKVHYQQAIDIREGIRAQCAESGEHWPPSMQNDLAMAYMNLANVLDDSGETAQAKIYYQQAIDIREGIRTQCKKIGEPWPPSMQNSLASAYVNLANLLQNAGETAQAKVHYQQAIDIREGIRAQCAERGEPWPPSMQNVLAGAHMNLANVLDDSGETAQAKIYYQQAIDIREAIRTQCAKSGEPWPPSMQNNLASAYVNLANLLQNAGETAQAKVHYQQAIDIREGIRTQCAKSGEPWSPMMQNDLASAYMNLANVLDDVGEAAQAKIHYQHAIEIKEGIRTQCTECAEPWSPMMQNDLAMVYMNFANLLSGSNEAELAKVYFEKALDISEGLVVDSQALLNTWHMNMKLWRNYLLNGVDNPVMDKFVLLAQRCITLIELYPDKESHRLGFVLLHTMMGISLKQGNYGLALKLVHCVQGRELAYTLDRAQLDEDTPESVQRFVACKSAYQGVLATLSKDAAVANNADFLAQLSAAKAAYQSSRDAVAVLPEYAPLLAPIHIELSDIQATQGEGEVSLIWLSLEAIHGVMLIPVEGAVQFIDLSDSLNKVVTLHEDLSVLLNGDSGVRKHALASSPEERLAMMNRYLATPLSHPGLMTKQHVQSVCLQLWQGIETGMDKIWQDEGLQAGLAQYDVSTVRHITQGATHNVPLDVSSPAGIYHQFVPGLAVLRQRQALDMAIGNNVLFDKGKACHSHICSGEAQARASKNKGALIPHTICEQGVLSKLTQGMRCVQGSDEFTLPDRALSLVHLGCHGGMDTQGAGGAVLKLGRRVLGVRDFARLAECTIDVMLLNACVGGTTHDDTQGEHHGLLIPLLTKTRQVIASTLPIDDKKAGYFASLFGYYYVIQGQTVTASVVSAKQALLSGQWPEFVTDAVLSFYQAAIVALSAQDRQLLLKGKMRNVTSQLHQPCECYALAGFDFTSLEGDTSDEDEVEAMLAIIQTQLTSITPFKDEVASKEARIAMAMFVHSVRVFG